MWLCNIKLSLCLMRECKEIWNENLAIYQTSLRAFSQAQPSILFSFHCRRKFKGASWQVLQFTTYVWNSCFQSSASLCKLFWPVVNSPLECILLQLNEYCHFSGLQSFKWKTEWEIVFLFSWRNMFLLLYNWALWRYI